MSIIQTIKSLYCQEAFRDLLLQAQRNGMSYADMPDHGMCAIVKSFTSFELKRRFLLRQIKEFRIESGLEFSHIILNLEAENIMKPVSVWVDIYFDWSHRHEILQAARAFALEIQKANFNGTAPKKESPIQLEDNNDHI